MDKINNIQLEIQLDIDAEYVRSLTEEYKVRSIIDCINATKNNVILSAKSGRKTLELDPAIESIEYGIPTDTVMQNIEFAFTTAGFRVRRNDHSIVISW